MRHRWRKVIIGIVIVLCALSIFGCRRPPETDAPGDGETPGQGEPPGQEEPPVQEGPLILLSLPEPGNGSGFATVEVMKATPIADDPSQCFMATFRVVKDGKTVEWPNQVIHFDDLDLAVWLDDHKVLFDGCFLADLSGDGSVTPITSQGVASPDRKYMVGWSLTGDVKSWALIDAGDLSSVTIKSFAPEDWGESEYAVAMHACWLDDGTILFDGPSQGSRVVYQYDVGSGQVSLFLDHAWGIRASPGGTYLAYAVYTDPAPGAPETPRLVLRRAAGGEPLHVPSVDPYGARVYWNEETGTAAVVDDTTVYVLRIEDSGLAQMGEFSVSGDALAVSVTATEIRFLELTRQDGVPIALIERSLQCPAGD